MKKILLLISIALIFSSCSFGPKTNLSSYEKSLMNGYVEGSEDIPLIKSLVKVNSGNLGFDTNSGSIYATNYRNWRDPDQVKDFYTRTLPQLGWRLIRETQTEFLFVRGKEKVEISFVVEEGQNFVKFLISSGV